jgi:hypothetical protein
MLEDWHEIDEIMQEFMHVRYPSVYYTPPQILKESSGSPQTPQGVLRTL